MKNLQLTSQQALDFHVCCSVFSLVCESRARLPSFSSNAGNYHKFKRKFYRVSIYHPLIISFDNVATTKLCILQFYQQESQQLFILARIFLEKEIPSSPKPMKTRKGTNIIGPLDERQTDEVSRKRDLYLV